MRNVAVLVLITGVGMAVGFRIHGSVPAYVGALGLVLLFAFAFSWVVATVGLGAPSGEAAQAAVFPAIQAYAWTQQAAGKAKVSPDTIGIAKP